MGAGVGGVSLEATLAPAVQDLKTAKRLVVKIGSALLVESDGALRQAWLTALAADVAQLRQGGVEVILVSSGAIAVGRSHLGLPGRPLYLEEKQAAAACGQILLGQAYKEALAPHDVPVAQILLTLSDTEERRRHLNARATLNQLLRLGALPVVNENDTIATSEIRIGDNDRLAARVAVMTNADTLVLLSDIDGLYTADPRRDPAARHIPTIERLTPAIMAMGGKAPPGHSSGGMATKLVAARLAGEGGCRMAIADGRAAHALAHLAGGGKASWFAAVTEPMTARKRWIKAALDPRGRVRLDAGAVAALQRGKSLLPAGVTACEGDFRRGDLVILSDPQGNEVGRGLSAYDAADALRIRGCQSSEIESLLGFRGREELVHRDDLVLSGD
ncbi:MAG: glutamate 5-kinase [Rhodospirillales bacterium]